MKQESDGSIRSDAEDMTREQRVLAGMIRYTPIIPDVMQLINPDDFFDPRCKLVFAAVANIFSTNARPDHIGLPMVVDYLERTESVHHFGGTEKLREFLADLLASDPTGAWCLMYAEQARELSVRKAVSMLGHRLVHETANPSQSIEELITETLHELGNMGATRQHGELRHIREGLLAAQAELDRRRDGELSGITTGVGDLDALTDGLQRGELTTIGARPSVGKTAFAVNIAKAAAKAGKPVAFFSLEQSEKELAFRLIAGESGVCSHSMRRHRLNNQQAGLVVDSCHRLGDLPIYINDHGRQTGRSIHSLLRRAKQRLGIQIAFVDYVQLLTGDNKLKRHEQLGEITRTLKFIARDMDMAVVILAQVNRTADSRDQEQPKLSDLKDSGSIEQDSDVVILLHRTVQGDQIDEVEANIRKQRNGPIGKVNLMYRRATMTFEQRARGIPI